MSKPSGPPKPGPLADALRSEIARRGLTAYGLNKLCGVNIDSVHRFMAGQRGLTLETADVIAHALDMVLVARPLEP